MPACVVLVHHDPQFIRAICEPLKLADCDVAAFPDPIVALDALDTVERLQLLITCVDFPAGRSNGVALARMMRNKRPGVKILFIAPPELQDDVKDLGSFIAAPATPQDVILTVERLLEQRAEDTGRLS